MRSLIILAFALVLPAQAEAQAPAETPAPRLITVTAGSGNSMGWLGLQGERYLRSDRFSVFGGIGYVPASDPGDSLWRCIRRGNPNVHRRNTTSRLS